MYNNDLSKWTEKRFFVAGLWGIISCAIVILFLIYQSKMSVLGLMIEPEGYFILVEINAMLSVIFGIGSMFVEPSYNNNIDWSLY